MLQFSYFMETNQQRRLIESKQYKQRYRDNKEVKTDACSACLGNVTFVVLCFVSSIFPRGCYDIFLSFKTPAYGAKRFCMCVFETAALGDNSSM